MSHSIPGQWHPNQVPFLAQHTTGVFHGIYQPQNHYDIPTIFSTAGEKCKNGLFFHICFSARIAVDIDLLSCMPLALGKWWIGA
eukprot:1142190-Pelagomonas_calceolata.AAC.8